MKPVLIVAGIGIVIGMIAAVAWKQSRPRPNPPLSSTPPPPPPTPVPVPVLAEAFDGDKLDAARWVQTVQNDFEERTVDLKDSRLRLRAATRGTRDDTVKFFGVRSAESYPLSDGMTFSAELDWNDQANGSYLSAGWVLAPEKTEGNPLVTPNWLRVEYIGVPPGKNGRIVVVTRNAGREEYLFTEGWPEVRREGRKIGVQKIEIAFRKGAFRVSENGKMIFESKEKALSFDRAHVYLQMSSHSNYPPREVFFDNIRLTPGP